MADKKTVTDEEQGVIFKAMLRTFEEIIDKAPVISKVKQPLLDLAERAGKAPLTARQADAIYGRCMNYINGTYGVDRIKEEYAKSHP